MGGRQRSRATLSPCWILHQAAVTLHGADPLEVRVADVEARAAEIRLKTIIIGRLGVFLRGFELFYAVLKLFGPLYDCFHRH